MSDSKRIGEVMAERLRDMERERRVEAFDDTTWALARDIGADCATYPGIILRAGIRALQALDPGVEGAIAIEEAIAEFARETKEDA